VTHTLPIPATAVTERFQKAVSRPVDLLGIKGVQ